MNNLKDVAAQVDDGLAQVRAVEEEISKLLEQPRTRQNFGEIDNLRHAQDQLVRKLGVRRDVQ